MGPARILFITPAATRTGAPMLMLHLARWMRRLGGFEMSAVLVTGGEMESELSAEMPTARFWIPDARTPSAAVRWFRQLPAIARRRKAVRAARCRAVVNPWPPDVVFVNSAGGAEVLEALGPFTCPVIFGVHEMRHVLRLIAWPTGDAATTMSRYGTHFIAGSRAVERNLVEAMKISPQRVTVVHDFVAVDEFSSGPAGASHSNQTRLESLGVPENAVVVGCIASVEWRKGADLFVSLARLLPEFDRTGRPVHLVWVGGGAKEAVAQLDFDVQTAGLSGRVHLAGPTSRTADWYPLFTVQAMLSREDPFPLVALEAAVSGVPAVCFANSGGVPELVESDAGRVVPFLDLSAFAAAIMEIIDDPQLHDRLGHAAADKARTRHDVSVAGPQVIACIRQVMQQSQAAPGGQS